MPIMALVPLGGVGLALLGVLIIHHRAAVSCDATLVGVVLAVVGIDTALLVLDLTIIVPKPDAITWWQREGQYEYFADGRTHPNPFLRPKDRDDRRTA